VVACAGSGKTEPPFGIFRFRGVPKLTLKGFPNEKLFRRRVRRNHFFHFFAKNSIFCAMFFFRKLGAFEAESQKIDDIS
jgi:hypothetical protein